MDLYKDQSNKVSKLNKYYHNKLRDLSNGSRIITQLIENELRNEGVNVSTGDSNDSGGNVTYLRNGKLIKFKDPYLTLRNDAHDSVILHERRHLKNIIDSINGSPDQRSGYINQSNEKMKKHNDNPPEYTVDNVLNYVNRVQQEELSANRGAVMDGYISGGKNKLNAYTKDDGLLDEAYKVAEVNQSTYDSLVGGYRPPSNRWNMDKDSYENLTKRIKS